MHFIEWLQLLTFYFHTWFILWECSLHFASYSMMFLEWINFIPRSNHLPNKFICPFGCSTEVSTPMPITNEDCSEWNSLMSIRPTCHSLQADKSGITDTSQELSCLKVAWDFGFAKGQKAKQHKEPSLIHERETLSGAFIPRRGPGLCSLHVLHQLPLIKNVQSHRLVEFGRQIIQSQWSPVLRAESK